MEIVRVYNVHPPPLDDVFPPPRERNSRERGEREKKFN